MKFGALLLLCGSAWAAGQEYYPLEVGNQWVYKTAGTRAVEPRVLEITRTGEFNGRTYYRLEGMPAGAYWLRGDENGSLWSFDPDAGGDEKLWYAFSTPEKTQYQNELPGGCCGRAMVNSRNAAYRGPVGEFDYALEMTYPGTFQVGVYRELFLPWVGLVHRTENTGGPSVTTWDLMYARLGAATIVAQPEVGFGLSLDQAVYVANLMPPVDPVRSVPVLTARMTLRNTLASPLVLNFPSGQSFDLAIRNDRGEVVLAWSADKLFPAVARTETVQGERNWATTLRLETGGRPLPPGRYTAEAWLTTAGPRTYAATVGFEVQHVF